MEANKEVILEGIERNGKFYRRAYKYLAAAKLIKDDIAWKVEEALEIGQVNVAIYNLISDIFENAWISPTTGKDRHLFGSAYTPTGWHEYTDTLLEDLNKTYYITGEIGTGKSKLLEKVYNEAIIRGIDVEVYHTPLVPEKIETVIIKELNIGLTTSKLATMFNAEEINLDQYIDQGKLEVYKEDIEEDKKIFLDLVAIASKEFAKAKKNHDGIEESYVPNMDFEAIEEVRKEIISRMLSYEK
ncbi:ATP-binding protein [Sporosalibacterium faouarense]|uniref:ATP-binding protein n=1 Tax=Sporosalibacterium faouarense TaxID=516123 RepID=UPI001FB0176D|nr:ATP-binding protein [Sporosalibacterium faouarense]